MPTQPRIRYGYIIAVASFVISFLLPSLNASLGIFIKPIQDDLGWSRTVISGAFSLSLIAGGVAGIIFGKLNDRIGPRFVITLLTIIAAAGYVLIIFLHQQWQLYLFLGILTGIGSNVAVPVLSTIARWFTQKRSLMSGLVTSGTNAGMIAYPLFISFLFQTQTWRNTFLILGLIILVIGLVAAQLLRRDPKHLAQTTPETDITAGQTKTIETGFFTLRQAMHTGQFWLFTVAMFLFGFCFFSTQLHIAAHVTDLGFSPANSAAVLSIIGGAAFTGMIIQGFLGDRIGNMNAFVLSPIFFTISLVIFIFSRDLWAFYIAAVFFGFAQAASVQGSPITAHFFGLKWHGQIYGFFMFSLLLGGAIGPLLSGYIFDITQSYLVAFITNVAFAVVFLILVVTLRKPYAEKAVG